MIIASWNVNSVRARLPILMDWLKTASPDVVLLQEIKCEESAFPAMEIQSAGYYALVKGQKSYNGVAILTKRKAELRRDALLGDDANPQSRYIEAEIDGWIVASLYFPNGNPKNTEKFPYKLSWMKWLHAHAQKLLEEERPVVLGGDYNVIPEAIDAAFPQKWVNDALFSPEARGEFRKLKNLGYYDALRQLHPNAAHLYTFWDYLAGAFDRGDGIRIDHLMLSPEAADRLTSCRIDRHLRALEKASDHVPIVGEFKE
ncbi:MAG TPA: exodeoxyribonuclease III [Alphaproteobacteria bacterium]|nr:exodeoxyribonuclease III [Alphaproteobacteria bacterium]